jgi:hypothetical protein
VCGSSKRTAAWRRRASALNAAAAQRKPAQAHEQVGADSRARSSRLFRGLTHPRGLACAPEHSLGPHKHSTPRAARTPCVRVHPARPLLPESTDLLDALQSAERLGCAVAVVGAVAAPGGDPGSAAGRCVGAEGQLLYANASAAAALSVSKGDAGYPAQPTRVRLPGRAAMVEVVAAAQCVAAQAVAWDPVPLEAQGAGMRGANGVNGSSGDGSSGDGSSDDGSTSSSELIVDLLVICPVTAPNGAAPSASPRLLFLELHAVVNHAYASHPKYNAQPPSWLSPRASNGARRLAGWGGAAL